MPRTQPDMKAEGINTYKPTAEELAAARAILSACDSKKKHSQMQSMSNWLKRNPQGEGNGDASSSRGDQRTDYLCKYMAWQLRKHSGQTMHEEKASETSSHAHKVEPKTEFQLRKEFGDVMFDYWRKSGKLRAAPNRITGSMEEEVCEWLVDQHEYVKKHEHQNSTGISSTAESQKEDYENVSGLQLDLSDIFVKTTTQQAGGGEQQGGVQGEEGSGSDGQAGGAQVKKEPTEKPDEREQEAREFLATPSLMLTKMQQASTTIKVMCAQCADIEFSETFRAELEAVAQKLDRTTKIISRICMGSQVLAGRVPKLLASLRAQLLHVSSLEKIGAQRFGMDMRGATGGAKRRRKGPAAKAKGRWVE